METFHPWTGDFFVLLALPFRCAWLMLCGDDCECRLIAHRNLQLSVPLTISWCRGIPVYFLLPAYTFRRKGNVFTGVCLSTGVPQSCDWSCPKSSPRSCPGVYPLVLSLVLPGGAHPQDWIGYPTPGTGTGGTPLTPHGYTMGCTLLVATKEDFVLFDFACFGHGNKIWKKRPPHPQKK